MISGELEATSFKYTLFMSKWLLCIFILLVSIMLMNLLNGLAVSDVQEINNKAEIVTIKSIIKTIFYIERFISMFNIIKQKISKYGRFKCKIFTSTNKNDYVNNFTVEIYINQHGLVKKQETDNIEEKNRISDKLPKWLYKYFFELKLNKSTYDKIKQMQKAPNN